MSALVRQDDARLFLNVAHRTQSVGNGDELWVPRSTLFHALVELRVDGFNLVQFLVFNIFVDGLAHLLRLFIYLDHRPILIIV